MERKAILTAFWRAVAAQERDPLRGFFAEGAEVLWPNTNERFSVEEYLRANCEYPGKWNGKIERMLDTVEASVTVTRVWSEEFSVRAISFFRWQGRFCGWRNTGAMTAHRLNGGGRCRLDRK